MKTIQAEVYEARDGKRFLDAGSAMLHETRLTKLAAIEDIMLPLGSLPDDDGCRFGNGHGYIQRDRAACVAAAEGLVRAFAEFCPSQTDYCQRVVLEGSWACRHGMIGRIISDCDSDFWRAWSRLGCIDEQFREWGQAYYALPPQRGEFFEIKP